MEDPAFTDRIYEKALLKLKFMHLEDMKVVENMERYGGSFVQALAELARHADPNNLMKIKLTWADYWEEYENWNK